MQQREVARLVQTEHRAVAVRTAERRCPIQETIVGLRQSRVRVRAVVRCERVQCDHRTTAVRSIDGSVSVRAPVRGCAVEETIPRLNHGGVRSSAVGAAEVVNLLECRVRLGRAGDINRTAIEHDHVVRRVGWRERERDDLLRADGQDRPCRRRVDERAGQVGERVQLCRVEPCSVHDGRGVAPGDEREAFEHHQIAGGAARRIRSVAREARGNGARMRSRVDARERRVEEHGEPARIGRRGTFGLPVQRKGDRTAGQRQAQRRQRRHNRRGAAEHTRRLSDR